MNNVKSLFIIIFLVIFCLCSTSCIDYECTQGDCKNGFGTAVYTDGDEYVGEWKMVNGMVRELALGLMVINM